MTMKKDIKWSLKPAQWLSSADAQSSILYSFSLSSIHSINVYEQQPGRCHSISFLVIKTCLDGTLSKVRIGNYLSSSFPIENGQKQGDALSPLLFNFALEYAIRKVQETNLGLDINGTHQVFAYADDVNLIGDDNRTIERNADVLLNACKVIGQQ